MSHELRQVARYALVGGLLFGLDLLVFLALVRVGAHVAPAQLVSRSTGALAGFVLHRAWTFSGDGRYAHGATGQGAGYVALILANLALSPLLVTLLARLQPSLVAAKVLAEVVMVVSTFLASRRLFRREPA